jgi:flagellar hook protein FlgE
MKQGRVVFSLLLLASGCVNITLNNNGNGAGDAGGGGVVGSLGGTSGGTRGAGGAGPDSSASHPPRPTDSVTIRGNLDQTASAPIWDSTTPQTTSNFTTSLIVYDSLGMAIQIDIYFGKDDAVRIQPGDSGDWTYHVMTDGANLAFESDGATGAVAGMATQIAVGTLRFDTMGRLVSNTVTAEGFYPKDAVYPQMLTFNFGTGTDSGGSGLDGLTQYAATSAVSFAAVSGSAFAP